MDECHVTTAQINREIQQEDIPNLAVHFDDVDFYTYVMELSPGERSDVRLKKIESNHLAMIECLTIWKRREHSQATFRALLEMLIKLKKQKIAEEICQYLSVSGVSGLCVPLLIITGNFMSQTLPTLCVTMRTCSECTCTCHSQSLVE